MDPTDYFVHKEETGHGPLFHICRLREDGELLYNGRSQASRGQAAWCLSREHGIKPLNRLMPDNAVSLEELEDQTALSLVVLIDDASDALWRFFQGSAEEDAIGEWHKSDDLLKSITDRACAVFSSNEKFRKEWLKPDPREHAQMFIQHWVAADFVKEFPELAKYVPPHFLLGRPMYESASEEFATQAMVPA